MEVTRGTSKDGLLTTNALDPRKEMGKRVLEWHYDDGVVVVVAREGETTEGEVDRILLRGHEANEDNVRHHVECMLRMHFGTGSPQDEEINYHEA